MLHGVTKRCYRGCPNRKGTQVRCKKCLNEQKKRAARSEMWVLDRQLRERIERE